jgi:hypothetical protein
MSFWKDYEDEQCRTYNSPKSGEKFVCSSHFNNKYLRLYINNKGQIGECSYCSKRGTVIDMSDFINYVGDRITNYIGPVDDEGLYLSKSFFDDDDEVIPGIDKFGDYAIPSDAERYENVNEVMEDYDLVTDNDVLNDDIANCFNVDYWIRRDPMGLLMKDELMQLWMKFSNLVKTKLRYTFFRSAEYYDGLYHGLESDIIAEVSNMVGKLEETIDVGTMLYRGRPEDNDAPFEKFESLTAPPAQFAKENRMSPYGISTFYGSFDDCTPIKEIKNYLDDKSKKIYLGEFEVTRQLKVINLCAIPSPDFWMDNKDDWQQYAFLHNFHTEISKPVGVSANPKLEYIPTQVFCEYLRYIQKSKDGKPYDGIIYSSAMTKDKNVALFFDNKTSSNVLKLNKVELI